MAIDEGRDPAVEKQEDKSRVRTAWTVRDLDNDFRVKHLLISEYAQETIDARNRTWTVSKRILTSSSKLFNHARGLRITAANPCTGIKLKSIKGPRPPIRKRVMLLESELRELLPDIDVIGTENALVFRILLAACVRGIELVRTKKEHVFLDRGMWWVSAESVKTRRELLVPLPPVVVG